MEPDTPETVGLASDRLARISRAMQRYVDEGVLPGAVAMVARRGQIAYAECFGWMDIEARKPMRLDTILPIGSMQKPITSVAAMMLYEEGHFQLYDPVSKFIPEFKDVQVYAKTTEAGMELTSLERELTIHNLFTHTSGLASGFGWLGDQPLGKVYEEIRRPDLELQDLVQKLAKLPLLHQPGAAWRYGESYEVLAYLVEVISGMPFAAFLEQRILEPLGMVDTGYRIPKERQDRLATSYVPSEAGGLVEEVRPRGWTTHPTLTRGGFGLLCTASDFMRFAQMLLNEGELDRTRLLGRKTVQYMTKNHMPRELMPIMLNPHIPFSTPTGGTFVVRGLGYGLGFSVLADAVQFGVMGSEGEYMWGGGHGTHFWVDPKEELIGLLMMRLGSFAFYPTWDAFRVLTYQAIVD